MTSHATVQARKKKEKNRHGRDGFSHVKQTFARLSSAVKSGVNVVKVSSEMGCIFILITWPAF
jgi:hypothetical protein